jgi:hypothetical protein
MLPAGAAVIAAPMVVNCGTPDLQVPTTTVEEKACPMSANMMKARQEKVKLRVGCIAILLQYELLANGFYGSEFLALRSDQPEQSPTAET